ncbi:MAG: hypothetical protein LBL33_09535 [Tannerella sp.]|nr:hypothetical protein [Tannerella sp.]
MASEFIQRMKVSYARERKFEALAKGKKVCREASTEGSRSAKFGTDEQKRNKRLNRMGVSILVPVTS